jgi:hypothetical protein
VRVFLFRWFEPTHCPSCERANARGEAIFALLRDLAWDDAEQARLRYEARFMLDEEN